MTSQEALSFYTSRYAMSGPILAVPGGRAITLGDRQNRRCRFCCRTKPDVTFKMRAHAVPELLGNRSLFTAYECDACNQLFGHGIENDLGNWTKPFRTLARVAGKNGVPALKGGVGQGWRIEHGAQGFEISHYEADPIFTVDEERKQIRFTLERDIYTPVAVLKAFVKIGLTLLPPDEVEHFADAIGWVREEDHSEPFITALPIFHTSLSGPLRPNLVSIWLFRRKRGVSDAPYAFMVLGYGNEIFQVCLPSPTRDECIRNQPLDLPPFPTPQGSEPERYGPPCLRTLDLTGREPVKGQTVTIPMGYESRTQVLPDKSA